MPHTRRRVAVVDRSRDQDSSSPGARRDWPRRCVTSAPAAGTRPPQRPPRRQRGPAIALRRWITVERSTSYAGRRLVMARDIPVAVRPAYGWCAGAVGGRQSLRTSHSPHVRHHRGHHIRHGSGSIRWQGVRQRLPSRSCISPKHTREGEKGETFRSDAAPGAPLPRRADTRSGRFNTHHRRHGVALRLLP